MINAGNNSSKAKTSFFIYWILMISLSAGFVFFQHDADQRLHENKNSILKHDAKVPNFFKEIINRSAIH